MSKIYWCWSNPVGSLRRLWQNITRGWNDSDCWSLDHTIAEFVLPRLKVLQKNKHGVPSSVQLSEETKNALSTLSEKEKEEREFEELQKVWDSILSKMVKSFEFIILDGDDLTIDHSGIEYKFIKSITHPDCSTMKVVGSEEAVKKYNDSVRLYCDIMREREKQIKEGLLLFAEYFRGLWD